MELLLRADATRRAGRGGRDGVVMDRRPGGRWCAV